MDKRSMTVFSILLFVLIVVGCRRESAERGMERTLEKAPGQEVYIDERKGTITVETEKGQKMVIGGATLPAGFPKDVPLLPGAEVTTSFTSGDQYAIVLTSLDNVEKVTNYYQEALDRKGWHTEATVSLMGMSSFEAIKGEKRLRVDIGKSEPNKSVISLTVTKRE